MRASSWLILICLVVSFAVFVYPPLVNLLAFTPRDLFTFKFWTLITALFVHGSFFHLLGNMLFLFVLGRTVEEEVGADRLVLVFFVGGILSFILSFFFYELDTVMVGASAAIFSVSAVAMLVNPLKFSILFLAPVGAIALGYFLFNVVMVYYGVTGNVGYIAHIIGFCIGIPFGIAWSKRWGRNLVISIILVLIYMVALWLISMII